MTEAYRYVAGVLLLLLPSYSSMSHIEHSYHNWCLPHKDLMSSLMGDFRQLRKTV